MFNINKIKPKSFFGPVKAKKFSQCLSNHTPSKVWEEITSYTTGREYRRE